jgi:adenylate kinase
MEQPRGFNLLVTGTPGTGKSSLSELLTAEMGLRHLEIGKIIQDNGFFSEHDEEFDTKMVDEDDEDRLLDFLEPLLMRGGNVVDYHSCEFFPKRWFHAVVVLRTDTAVHFDRLAKRGYNEKKQAENRDAEIFSVVEEEAREAYDAAIVATRANDTMEDMMATVEFIMGLAEGHPPIVPYTGEEEQ